MADFMRTGGAGGQTIYITNREINVERKALDPRVRDLDFLAWSWRIVQDQAMVAPTAVRQKLRALCHDTPWIYAVFWKLKNLSGMLTWEDGYIDNGKSDVYVRNALDHGILSCKSGTTYFCCTIDIGSGRLILCPTHIAMTGISHHSYTIGEGVVRRMASADTHVWIVASELNSEILSDCPTEWQLQFAAGIKTVLLVPVIPFGVVQLGSLDMVMDEFNVVAHIRDLFSMLQLTAGACSDMTLRLGQSASKECLFKNPSASSPLTGNLTNPIQSQQLSARDFMACDNGQENGDGIFATGHHPYPFYLQDNFPDQVITPQGQEMDAGCMEESIWKLMYRELLGDPNDVFFEHDICEEGISQINTNLSDNNYLAQNDQDILFAENMFGQTLWKNLEASDMINDQLLSFPAYCELHKALGPGSLEQHADHVWNISSSKTAQSNRTPSEYETLIKESKAWLTKGNDTGHLLDAVITNSRHASDDDASEASKCTKSYSSSSEKVSDSCLTQCKAESNPPRFDDSLLLGHENYAAFPFEGIMDSPRKYSSNSSDIFSNDEHQKRGSSKFHPVAKGRGKKNDLHRPRPPRPRDRQLIQDRVKELRELVPNGLKCSIDALLDRTVKHMLFLQNISCQAGRLQHCSQLKVKDTGPCLSKAQTHQAQASWVYQLGKPEGFPLIIESLDKPGHLLVEMVCKEYGVFLEIAQVIRSMRLTILKGVLINKSEELWAHFIVETSRGFHRMDIFLPLMQLLQRNSTPTAPIL
ncbi:hypothetical protein J5N97_002388 [Dioscorea zingiberensis]|uniref:BHLH domain-containing protein n=1 Tax=Dioscorea zingiberensis TaxID=325984 RepID=A0A9D5HQC8_9LILI|nr:hypothetical protein J5N97_002388 [Dioscorea zingiberensis]